MKANILFSAIAAMLGLRDRPVTTMVLKPEPAYEPPLSLMRSSQERSGNRMGLNQRQIRKNRRRAHAAGVRHAFP